MQKATSVAVPTPEPEEEKALYTVRTTKIDKYSTARRVVPIGPVTCPVCGFDPVQSNQKKFMVDSYEDLDDEGKLIARSVYLKHSGRHGDLEKRAAHERNLTLTKPPEK